MAREGVSVALGAWGSRFLAVKVAYQARDELGDALSVIDPAAPWVPIG